MVIAALGCPKMRHRDVGELEAVPGVEIEVDSRVVLNVDPRSRSIIST